MQKVHHLINQFEQLPVVVFVKNCINMSGFVGNDSNLVDVISDPLQLPDYCEQFFTWSGLQPYAADQAPEVGILGELCLGSILIKGSELLLAHTGADPPVASPILSCFHG